MIMKAVSGSPFSALSLTEQPLVRVANSQFLFHFLTSVSQPFMACALFYHEG